MPQQSILLSIDGSIYSRHAADLCWHLANATGAKVTALHVIDTRSAHEFIVHEPSGFIPSKDYQSTYDLLHKQLGALARNLEHHYITESSKHGVKTDFVIDEGDPVAVIARHARKHDLVVIGHRPHKDRAPEPYRRQFLRLSVAEALAHDCPRPLLIVQDGARLWSEMTVLLSMDHLNEQYIDACLNLAELLDLEPSIVCLSGSGHQEEPVRFIDDLRKANPKIQDTPIQVTSLADISTLKGEAIPGHCALSADASNMSTTLPVIPTREIGGNRITILGGSASLFVRFLALSTILLLPEEHLLKQPSSLPSKVGAGQKS